MMSQMFSMLCTRLAMARIFIVWQIDHFRYDDTRYDSQYDQDDQNTKAETFEKFAVLFELHRLCLEIVAHTPFGVYIFRLTGIGLDLFSQAADMYIYGTDISRIFIAPYDIQKIFSAVYLVRIEYQQFQHIKFLGCEVNLFSGDKYAASFAVQLQFSDFHSLGLLLLVLFAACTADDRLMRALTSRILKGLVT